MTTYNWDVFISHASEDKTDIVLPLTNALQRGGIKVWLDNQQLEIGDSLRQKIDEGLSKSRFGIVILSEHFFQKHWPSKELDGLTAKERNGFKVILPVWHNIDEKRITEFSPLLASVIAAKSELGIDKIASQILRIVLKTENGSPSSESPSITRKLIEIIESNYSTTRLIDFLKANDSIIVKAFGNSQGASPLVESSLVIGDRKVDLGVSQFMHSTSRWRTNLIQFINPYQSILDLDGNQLNKEIEDSCKNLSEIRSWVSSNLIQARGQVKGISPSFLGIVFAGRRDSLTTAETNLIQDYNDNAFGILIRTYDYLIDLTLNKNS